MTGFHSDRHKRDSLDDWYTHPIGAMLLEYELALVNQILATLYGYYLLQPSVPNVFLQRYTETVVQGITVHCPDPSVFSDKPTFWGENHALPILSNTIDLVLLPHVLEFAACPEQMLQEYYRVLKPDGYLIILGFNPYSLFGLYRFLGRRKLKYPWGGKFLAKNYLLNCLQDLSCKVNQTQSYGFYYPGLKHNAAPYAKKIEQLAKRCLPMLGSAYLIVAQKKVVPFTLIKPRWKKPPSLASKLFAPSARRQ